jgi:hypothetical protein
VVWGDFCASGNVAKHCCPLNARFSNRQVGKPAVQQTKSLTKSLRYASCVDYPTSHSHNLVPAIDVDYLSRNGGGAIAGQKQAGGA